MTDPFLGDDLRIRYAAVLLREGQAAAWEAVAQLAAERLAPLVPWREISALSLDRAEVLEAERDALRAKVERLTKAEGAFLAEVARLRAALTEESAENDQWQKKVAELWAEIERLRAENEVMKAADYEALGTNAEVVQLRAALRGVLAEADRKTDAFDRAHAALERHSGA